MASWEAPDKSNRPYFIVGTATCGRAAGAMEIISAINSELTKHNIEAPITEVGCIGICYAEPIVEIVKPNRPHIVYGNVTPEIIPQIIEEYLINDNPLPDLALGTIGEENIEGIPKFWDLPMLKPQVRISLRNCGIINPENIDHYVARGGYNGLVNALKMSPEEVIEEVKKSGLRGRGGAGFPTGIKWGFCRQAQGTPKYLICNADEGDPGAFMDRSLLESDPHSVLEGMLIGAYAMGTTIGYIYCRAEYPLAIERLQLALEQMKEYGLIDDNILGSDLSFHIKIKEGAGAFVCGEETALIASIEGKRGMPRPRPPFPAQSGLWGKPTNINNVETWANVSAIFQHDGDWYAGYGTEKSKGTKTFALAGKINRTGLIEVPMGLSLREIIYGIGGGIPDNKEFKAVQTGGPSGGCLPADKLDLPVEYESLAEAGAIMGSGGMVVMDEETCMVDVARYFLSFTQSESCGKCVPCRVGTKQMLDILENITIGKGKPADVSLLLELCKSINAGSLCALGQTAPNPVLTTHRYFQEEYEAHTRDQICPALACTKLIEFYILPEKCQGCLICLRNCPVDAIVGDRRMVHVIDQSKCVKCGTCLDVCPSRFGAVLKVSGEEVTVPSEPIPVTAPRPAATAGTASQNE
ncbi:NADH-quinone oxidoreductase subunit NuoF [Chloroflexota bacterium]